MKHFKTRNSVYEYDSTNKMIRRVSGKNPPAEHCAGGEWVPYVNMLGPTEGFWRGG